MQPIRSEIDTWSMPIICRALATSATRRRNADVSHRWAAVPPCDWERPYPEDGADHNSHQRRLHQLEQERRAVLPLVPDVSLEEQPKLAAKSRQQGGAAGGAGAADSALDRRRGGALAWLAEGGDQRVRRVVGAQLGLLVARKRGHERVHRCRGLDLLVGGPVADGGEVDVKVARVAERRARVAQVRKVRGHGLGRAVVRHAAWRRGHGTGDAEQPTQSSSSSRGGCPGSHWTSHAPCVSSIMRSKSVKMSERGAWMVVMTVRPACARRCSVSQMWNAVNASSPLVGSSSSSTPSSAEGRASANDRTASECPPRVAPAHSTCSPPSACTGVQ